MTNYHPLFDFLIFQQGIEHGLDPGRIDCEEQK